MGCFTSGKGYQEGPRAEYDVSPMPLKKKGLRLKDGVSPPTEIQLTDRSKSNFPEFVVRKTESASRKYQPRDSNRDALDRFVRLSKKGDTLPKFICAFARLKDGVSLQKIPTTPVQLRRTRSFRSSGEEKRITPETHPRPGPAKRSSAIRNPWKPCS